MKSLIFGVISPTTNAVRKVLRISQAADGRAVLHWEPGVRSGDPVRELADEVYTAAGHRLTPADGSLYMERFARRCNHSTFLTAWFDPEDVRPDPPAHKGLSVAHFGAGRRSAPLSSRQVSRLIDDIVERVRAHFGSGRLTPRALNAALARVDGLGAMLSRAAARRRSPRSFGLRGLSGMPAASARASVEAARTVLRELIPRALPSLLAGYEDTTRLLQRHGRAAGLTPQAIVKLRREALRRTIDALMTQAYTPLDATQLPFEYDRDHVRRLLERVDALLAAERERSHGIEGVGPYELSPSWRRAWAELGRLLHAAR